MPCATSQPRLMHTGRPSAGGDDKSEPYLGVLSRKEVPGAERQDRPQIPGVALPSSPLHSFSPLQLVHACRDQQSLVSWPSAACREGKASFCLLLTGLPLVNHFELTLHQSLQHQVQMWPDYECTPVSICTLHLGGDGRVPTRDVNAHHQASHERLDSPQRSGTGVGSGCAGSRAPPGRRPGRPPAA